MGPPQRLAFMTQWQDPLSNVTWTYQLMVFPQSEEVELFDVKNRRTFLKRTKLEGMKPELFFVGSKVTIFGRQLDIVDYGDAFTQRTLADAKQRHAFLNLSTLALIKPDAVAHLSSIVEEIDKAGFFISQLRMLLLSKAEACKFYSVHEGKPFYDKLITFMASGKIVAMELIAVDAVAKWRTLIGPTDSTKARAEAPHTLRAKFGTDNTKNACHGSDAVETAAQECSFFFGSSRPGKCVVGERTTLCIIKPHVIMSKQVAPTLAEISGSFEIKNAEMFNVDKRCAAEFFEVYRGVVAASEYSGMVDELTSGPCLVLEIGHQDGLDPVERFRQLCGPADPEVAAALRPHSLRARFGVNKHRNAVHCTDLPEDGPLEVNYFFQILQHGG